MRVSRAQAEENRETVINVASRLFREHGFDGIGLKDLMKGAGLTQGGFYKQFSSKDDLAAQASRRATGKRYTEMVDGGCDKFRSPRSSHGVLPLTRTSRRKGRRLPSSGVGIGRGAAECRGQAPI